MYPKRFLSKSLFQLIQMTFIWGLIIILVWVVLPAAALPAATVSLTVDTTTDSNAAGYQACTAAANDCSLRGAVSKANADAANDYVITLPAGTYQLTLAGSGEDVNATGDLDFTAAHSVQLNGAGSSSTFIQAGSNASNGIDRVINVMAGTLTLQDVTIRYGKTSDAGGGILNDARLFILNSDVVTNTASSDGGGIENYWMLTVTNSRINGNTSAGSFGGGGIDNDWDGAFITITSSILSQNSSAADGGGIVNAWGTATISDTLISNNQAVNGGGIANDYEDVGSELYVFNSALVNNTATGDGGGLANFNTGWVEVTNSTFSGNTASSGSGGGIYNEEDLKITSSTLSGNSATTGGGLGFPSSWSTPWNYIQNSIFTNHTGNDCGNLTPSNATLTGSNNLIDTATCDKGLFVTSGAVTNFDTTLRNNGGRTPTHALQPGSNAIDAGNNSCPDTGGAPLTTDQRGYTRPVDYDGDGTATCDIGAFEAGLDETSSAVLTTGQPHVFGATRVTITLNSGDAGTVTVSRHSQPPGGGAPDSGEMPFHWRITPTGATYNLDLTLCYTDLDLSNGNGVVEANLQMFRNTGGPTWTAAGGTVDTVNNCVTLTGVTALSSWTLANGSPTAVSLQHMGAGAAVSPFLWPLLILLGFTGILLLRRARRA